MSRKHIFLNVWLLAAGLALSSAAAAQGTIKVGVLHSLSGTMAISETTLKDTVLMMVDEQNKKGGCSARTQTVVVDPASVWRFCGEGHELEKTRSRLSWMLDVGLRKSVLRLREGQRLLFYASMRGRVVEGIIYTERRPTSKRFRRSAI